MAEALEELNQHEKKIGIKTKKISEKEDRDEINAKLEFLKEAEKKIEIESPIADCIVWFDGDKWKACLDTSLTGDLENAKAMSSFCEKQEYGFISEKCLLTYCFNIHENGNLLEICVPNGSHGTHVAHIAAGHFANDPEKDGLAPGAQIISLVIGDLRKASSSKGFIRALNKCIQLKVDIINLSYRIPRNMDFSKNEELIKNVVEKHGIIFVAAAGNHGPGLSMVGNSRGITNPSIIYVGAYLTAKMKESIFSHYHPDEEPVVFPFSSRGPSMNGELGVTICAPGAAITGVSKNELRSFHLKNGTSMSSPNAVGNIACLLSAMKTVEIPISPFRVKFALMNTAMAPKDGSHHPFSLGAGIIQICSAFDFIKSETMKTIPPNLADIKVDIEGKRGIYLRESFEINLPFEFAVSVNPQFIDSSDFEEILNFGCPIVLKLSHGSETGFVKFPKYCQIPSPTFNIHVDPTTLESGIIHYSEIIGINPENPTLGPMFRIPITVIIPEKITSESDFTYKKELTLEPAIPDRIFLQSPIGCKYVGIKFKSLENQNVQDLIVQSLYLNQKTRCEVSNFSLPPKSKIFQNFPCPDGQTIEFCFIKEWENQNSTKIEITIKFFGFFTQPTNFMSVNATNKICFTNFLGETFIEPDLEFKHFCQPLSPFETILEAMKERDIIDGMQSFQLIITYKFNVTKAELYEFKHEDTEFYKKYLDSYLLQVSSTSRKHIFTCGIQGIAKLLEKGDYIIRVQFCHSDSQMLEKLKDTRLIAMQIFIPAITSNFYSNAESAFNNNSGEKTKNKVLKSGEKCELYFPAVPWFKYPTSSSAGSYLKGTLALHSKEGYKSKKHSSFDIIYLLAAPKDFLKEKKNRFEIEADKETEKSDQKSAIRDIEILYITKETDSTKAAAIFEKLSNEFPKHLPIFSAEIERLSKLKDFSKLKKAVEKLLEISESKKVAEFFGVKSEFSEENLRRKEIMEKKKVAIINGLFLQANLALDLFLESTTKEIPDIFRNGFDPRKDSNVVKIGENLNKNNEIELAEIETKDLKGIIESSNTYSSDITSKIEKHDEVSKMENPKNDSEEKIDSDNSDESLVKIESIKSESNAKSKIEKSENDNSEIDKRAFKNDETESVKITEEEIESVFRDYMLFADSSTENAKMIIAKYSVVHERFGTALLKLKEIITDKTTSADYLSTEKAIIQLLKKLKWDHLVEEAQKAILIKHQKFYRLF